MIDIISFKNSQYFCIYLSGIRIYFLSYQRRNLSNITNCISETTTLRDKTLLKIEQIHGDI